MTVPYSKNISPCKSAFWQFFAEEPEENWASMMGLKGSQRKLMFYGVVFCLCSLAGSANRAGQKCVQIQALSPDFESTVACDHVIVQQQRTIIILSSAD